MGHAAGRCDSVVARERRVIRACGTPLHDPGVAYLTLFSEPLAVIALASVRCRRCDARPGFGSARARVVVIGGACDVHSRASGEAMRPCEAPVTSGNAGVPQTP